MNAKTLSEGIDAALPDAKVIHEVSEWLWDDCNGHIEIDNELTTIPRETQLSVITKVFEHGRYSCCTIPFYAIVAIGDAHATAEHSAVAQYGFATLLYNEDRNLISVDIDGEMP